MVQDGPRPTAVSRQRVAVSRLSSEEWIDGAWAEFTIQRPLYPAGRKKLIGLAVASQVLLLPHYYQTEAAKLDGAIDGRSPRRAQQHAS